VADVLKTLTTSSRLKTLLSRNISDDPSEHLFVLLAFGGANYEYNYECSEDEICMERAIYYFERAKDRIEDANAGHRREVDNK